MIYFVALIVGLAGLLFGFDEGVIAGALQALRAQFDLSAFDEGLMTSAVPLGALFGALVGGPLSGRIGRRGALLAAASLFTVGALLAGLATEVWMLTACRLGLGFAVGVAAMVAPLYISEIAPANRRGMLVSVYQLAITLGILSAYLVNYAFDDRWRTMFMLGAVPGIALLLGMWMLTDTPRWYLMQGREAEAADALRRLHQGSDAELPLIRASLAEQTTPASWSELLSPVIRPAFIVGIGLFFLQQLSGINAVIYYAPTVFQEAGFDLGSTQLMATIGVGVVNVLMTLVGMALIDRIGRRKLLYLGFLGTSLSLSLIAIGAATGSKSLDILAVLGLIGYIASFAASIGPLPWVMMAEVFPARVRGLAMSVTTLSNWTFNFLVVFSFPLLVSTFGLGAVFGLYALVCAAGLVFTWRYVPETNGVTLEVIEQYLLSGKPLHTLRPTPHIQIHTDKPEISLQVSIELMTSVLRLSPYASSLMPEYAHLGQVAHQNQQINTALRELHARLLMENGTWNASPLSLHALGPQREVLMTFIEHLRFASSGFLASVGEGPADHVARRIDRERQ